MTLANSWSSQTNGTLLAMWLTDRLTSRITFLATTSVPNDVCGLRGVTPIGGDFETEYLAWLRANAALSVGATVVIGEPGSRLLQVDVTVVSERACGPAPGSVRIAYNNFDAIDLVGGRPSRVLVHSLGSRLLVIVVEAPTTEEFSRFLPIADAVLASLKFEAAGSP